MSYIDKNSNIVISARMTNEGRRLLSLGNLTFNTFRVGDSEIDYTTLGSNYDISLENILRAKAYNPDIKTPIPPTPNATSTYIPIPALNPVILETLINSPKIGFFQYDSGTTIQYTAYTDTVCHVLQADAIIPISGTTGGTLVSVYQAPTYGSNTYEPQIGDLMLVKMTNDELPFNATSPTVVDVAVPYLWYQVQGVTGSLSANTLQITVDRDFPSFPSYTGPNYSYATFYPLGTGVTKDYLFSDGGFYSGGCVWNMNNVWTYPMIGVDAATHEPFNLYGSESYVGTKEYFGYTSEILLTQASGDSKYCELVPSVSLIHYTNKETCENQSELKYGQKFYVDLSNGTMPKLIMPTLMWHRNFSGTIGQVFSGSTTGLTTQYVTLSGSTVYTPNPTGQERNIYYYNLVDSFNNRVGRVYPELHMFSIDDQELVAALSYKSNRNWTLPTVSLDSVSDNDGIIDSFENLYVTYLFESTSGYTTGLHCQNIVCINFPPEECPPTLKQAVEVQFPVGQLPFMTVSGGTGWYADKFYILAQKQPLGVPPDPASWKLMDFTSSINNHTGGTRINSTNIESTVFKITNTIYNSSTIYNLNDFIKIPQIAETNHLQFGDERFFFGNVEAIGATYKYRTKFVFNIPPMMFNTSTNPTWPNSGQKVHINEVGVYGDRQKLVAVGKMNLPIEMVPNATVIIEIAFDL